MDFRQSFTARLVAGIAAALIPAQTVSMSGCSCGPRTADFTQADGILAQTEPGAASERCCRGSRVGHSCCRGQAVGVGTGAGRSSSAEGCNCRAGSSTRSCCQRGDCAGGNLCHCAADDSVPASDPASDGSRTGSGKPSLSPITFAGWVAAPVAATSAMVRNDRYSTVGASSAPERLSVLCRLVI